MSRRLNDFFLERDNSAIMIIDIQDRLARVMEEREKVIANCLHLIELSKLLHIPLLVTEQYPKGLGVTVEEIRQVLTEYKPLEKLTFSCCDDGTFPERIKRLDRRQIIIAGMETHVCILQTCIGLLRDGYAVHVVSDAVTSRKAEDKEAGIQFVRDAGAVITCTETVLFQMLKVAGTDQFRTIAKRIK
jgi:isochorismate hydrolase